MNEIWHGFAGACFWVYMRGEIDDYVWSEYLQASENMLARKRGKVVHFLLSTSKTGPSRKQIKALGELADKYRREYIRMRATAFVFRSTITRATLHLFNLLAPKTFPERVFKRPTDALAWLYSISQDISPGLWADIVEIVGIEKVDSDWN